MSLPSERIDATHDLVYLAKHPFYEFALTRSAPSLPGLSPEPPLVHLRFTNQPQQPGVVLTLAGLAQFHDALSRLLDYVEQERSRWTRLPSSGTSLQGPIAPASEPLDHRMETGHLEAHRPLLRLNRLAAAARLCRLSGMVIAALIGLLSWALYSLSASKGEFKQLQATAAQTADLHPREPAIPHETPLLEEAGAQQATAQADLAPRIYLHIQSPAHRAAAEHLAARLQHRGYVVPKPAILVAKGPSRTEVRYFRTAEAEEATAIAVLLHEAYRPPVTTSYIRGYENASQSRAKQYEIWLGRELQ
jgi:hypothetical protein